MIGSRRLLRCLLSLAAALLLSMSWPGADALAQVPRTPLVVTVTDNIDPAPSRSQVGYSIVAKNDGTTKALNVVITATLPPNVQFVKCSTSTGKPCTLNGGDVTTTVLTLAAHKSATLTVVVTTPDVDVKSLITVAGKANGDEAVDDSNHQDTTVLPEQVKVVMQPSLLEASIRCGDVLTSDFFGSDQTALFTDSLGCAHDPVAVTMAASGKTLHLNRFKIVGAALGSASKGNIGILVAAGATNVTITGGSTNGTSGIEYFDYCLADQVGNASLTVNTLRCFRSRSAGLDIVSDGVLISNSLVDLTAFVSDATTESPGGVGIHASGNVRIKDTKVRRAAVIGIWADGSSDPEGDGPVVQIDGNTETSRVESASGVGILLDGGPHLVKDTYVHGDDKSTTGVIANGAGSILDNLTVKSFLTGIAVNGTGNQVVRTTVESIRQDAYVVDGANARLSGNKARPRRHGYVVTGSNVTLDSNTSELAVGHGFVVSGPAPTLTGNSAKQNKGNGFVLGSAGGVYDTNKAEANVGTGIVVNGSAGNIINNASQRNKAAGYNVTGTDNHFRTNNAETNTGAEYGFAAGNLDDGGNRLNGATFSFTTAGGTFN